MDFSVIFQTRTKKFWWMDIIFYFVVSLLVATVLCYVIFLIKNNWQRQDIQAESVKFANVGTDQQRQDEADVINYQKKINDFSGLFKNHEFASNVFAFMQTQTIPNVWFKQFSLDEKGGTVQLSGEADSMDALSRQVAVLEKNKYVTNVGNLNSSLGDSAKIEFNVSITLDQSIFSYVSDMTPILETSSPVQAPQNQAGGAVAGIQPPASPRSQEKLITAFDLSKPNVVGTIDENKFTITLNVPVGTDVKSLTPSIIISPLAEIFPASNTPEDFTSPVVYTVTAQDGSIQTYQASVKFLQAANAAKKPNGGLIIIVVLIVLIVVFAVAIVSLFVWRNAKKRKQGF